MILPIFLQSFSCHASVNQNGENSNMLLHKGILDLVSLNGWQAGLPVKPHPHVIRSEDLHYSVLNPLRKNRAQPAASQT